MSEEKTGSQSGAAAASMVGPIWFIGWLFTIGFAKITFWQGVLGLLIWPYYLGSVLAG